jgi:hypothetical protein
MTFLHDNVPAIFLLRHKERINGDFDGTLNSDTQ